jgi:hypothetical protein
MFSHLDSVIIQKKRDNNVADRVMRSSVALDDVLSEKKRESSPSDIGETSSEEANFDHLLEED